MAGKPISLPGFLAGDVIIFAGQGDLYSKLGRWLMRAAPQEAPTFAVHTAQFLDGRRVLEMDMVARVKNVEDVLNKRNQFDLWKRRSFEVWRCRALTAEQRRALTREAMTYVSVRFGFGKGIMHFLDGLLSKIARRDIYLFRRLDLYNHYPVCSGITAFVYDKVLNYRFGVEPDCADPDHIHDWLVSHPDDWQMVFRLERYPSGAVVKEAAAPQV